MFISNEQANNRLASSRNVAHRIVSETVRDIRGLRTIPESLGNKGLIPNVLKPVIAACAEVEGNDSAVARTFGITPASVKRFKENFGPESDEILAPVRDLAIAKLASSLSSINEEKLKSESPLQASNVARNLSQIYRNLTPSLRNVSGNSGDSSKYTLNIIAPNVKSIQAYETIDVVQASV